MADRSGDDKTAIENKQNLIVDGYYIPFDWEKNFTTEYLQLIKYFCFVMSENYIKNHFKDIVFVKSGDTSPLLRKEN